MTDRSRWAWWVILPTLGILIPIHTVATVPDLTTRALAWLTLALFLGWMYVEGREQPPGPPSGYRKPRV